MLKVERRAHMIVQVIWKDKTISWCAADAMRLQKPFLFIPYVIKNKLLKNANFCWVKDYRKHNETAKNIYKSFKTTSNPSKQPKYEFGIQVPNNTGHAYNLDKINNDKGW